MATNELDLTVVGWVGNDPKYYPGENDAVPYTQFRLAYTPRVFDREAGAYVDGATDWFTVKVFRNLARNVAESVRRGDPVLVRGRLRIDDWAGTDGQVRTTAVLTASAVGHNLDRGTSRFARTVHPVADEVASVDGLAGSVAESLAGSGHVARSEEDLARPEELDPRLDGENGDGHESGPIPQEAALASV